MPSVPEFGLSLALRAEGVYELDLTEKMHHFYLWGKLDNETLPVIPGVKDIKKSYIKKSRKRYNGEKWLHIVHCDLTVTFCPFQCRKCTTTSTMMPAGSLEAADR